MTSLPPRISITVGELVLRGVPPEQAPAMVAAFEQRLTALAAQHANPSHRPAAGTLHLARPAPIRTPANAPEALGARAAESVWASVIHAGQGYP